MAAAVLLTVGAAHAAPDPRPVVPRRAVVLDVRDFGARGDGVQDDVRAIQAAQAALPPEGGTLRFPEGVYAIGASTIVLQRSHLRLEGDGPGSILRKVRAGGPILATTPAPSGLTDVRVSGLRFEFAIDPPGPQPEIAISIGHGLRNLLVDRCEFWNFGGHGIVLTGVERAIVDRCSFASPGLARGTAVQLGGTTADVVVRRSAFRWLRNGFIVAAKPEQHESARDLTVENNHFDFGWWLIREMAANEGPTVSYTDGTLVDRGAKWKSLRWFPTAYDAGHDVRVMPVRARGAGAFTALDLTDSRADFVAAGVKRGEIVRTADAFGVVQAVGPQAVGVEEWLSRETYLPTAPPAEGAPYVLYGIVLGKISQYGDDAIDLGRGGRWFDLEGNRVTPAAGTRYEILGRRPNYPLHAEKASTGIAVRDNVFLRGWSDQISLWGNESSVTGNRIEQGEDMGITLHGRGNLVARNEIRFQGASGLWTLAEDSTIEDNRISDSQWVNTHPTGLGDLTLRNGRANRIRRNECERTSTPGKNGLLVIATDGGTSRDDVVEDNVCRNHEVADLAVRGVKGGVVTGCTLARNVGTQVIEGAVELRDAGVDLRLARRAP